MPIEIVDWGKHYENNRTRELKHMAWVPMPNRHDGAGFTQLLDHPNGLAHFGAWCLLIEVASRCDVRGTLLRRGGEPILIDSLASMTHTKREQWEEALPRLESIGWIRGYTIPQEGAGIPQAPAEMSHPSAIERNGTELNGREGREGKKPAPQREEKTEVEPDVFMTSGQRAKLVEEFGEADTASMITELSCALGNRIPKDRYKDHYKVIRQWIKKAREKAQAAAPYRRRVVHKFCKSCGAEYWGSACDCGWSE